MMTEKTVYEMLAKKLLKNCPNHPKFVLTSSKSLIKLKALDGTSAWVDNLELMSFTRQITMLLDSLDNGLFLFGKDD